MRFRPLWPDDKILCESCDYTTEFRWFTMKERENPWPDEMSISTFRLPCGHSVELFSDVVPLRGQLVKGFG